MSVRRSFALPIALVLALGLLTSCSEDSPDAGGSANTGGYEAPAGDAGADTASADTAGADTASADTAGATEPASVGPDPVLVTDPAPDGVEVTIGADGFDPSTIEVKAGSTVTFKSGDDQPHGIIVGNLDGASVMGGLIEVFQFPGAGTYQVFDEITEATATITVT